jgi:hypothetical protein
MSRLLFICAAAVLILHGLIHLMGTAAYLKLANISGLPYKTTLLNDRLDVGDTGIRAFGLLWAVAAVGFVVGAVALFGRLPWWRSVLVPVTGLSLALTALDWNVAFAGFFVNVAILVVMFLVR